MALLIDGLCISDASTALLRLQSQWPKYEVALNAGNSVNLDRYLSSSIVNMSTGSFTYSTKNALGTVLTTNSIVIYPTCGNENVPYEQIDLLFFVSIIFATFIGFSTGLRR